MFLHSQEGPQAFKRELKIKFANEEGVDEGGVKKEFFQLIVRHLFDVEYGKLDIQFTSNESLN